MALRMRIILPYALPGVLALVGCWWFFSRKKEEQNKKRKRLASPAVLHADDVLEELIPKNVLQSRVHQNGEACVSQDSLSCSVPSAGQVTLLSESQTDCKAEDSLTNEYPSHSVLLDSLQGSSLQEITEEISCRVQAGDGDAGTLTTEHNANEETNKIIVCDLGFCSGDVAEVCTTALRDHVQGMEPADKSEEALIGSCAENLLLHSEALVCSAEFHKTLPSFDMVESIMPQTNYVQSNVIYDFTPIETCSEALKNSTSEELHVESFSESSVQPCIDEIETVVKMSLLMQCPPSVARETGETEHASSQSIECNQAEQIAGSEPHTLNLNLLTSMETGSEHRNSAICGGTGNVLLATNELFNSSVKSSFIKMVREDNFPDLLDNVSQSLGNYEQSETTSSLMDCLEEWNDKVFCENCDTKTPPLLLHDSSKKTINTVGCEFALGSENIKNVCEIPCDAAQVLEPTVTSLNLTHLVKETTSCCDVTGSTTKSEIQQNKTICGFTPKVVCPEVEALKNILSEELHILPSTEQNVQPCDGELETVVKMSLLVQCPQSVTNETEIMSIEEADNHSFQSPEYSRAEKVAWSKLKSEQLSPMEAEICEIKGNILPTVDDLSNICVKPSSGEVVRENKCTDILDAFSQSLGKKDEFETTGSTVACLGEGNPNMFFGNYEAKLVEQLAMNIISKVIVAAKQEILSGSASDISGTCQVLDEKKVKLQKDSQSQYSALDETETNSSGIFSELNATCEYTQTEQSHENDIKTTGVIDDSCLELQRETVKTLANNVAHTTQSLSNLSPVHQSADFFDDSQAAMEDSSISVCTSEDGISMEEPLQSTVMSNVGVGSYDSLSSSAIELSTENINVFSERPKKAGAMENKTVSLSNGDVKKCPADVKNEGPLTGDTEVYHSGGSDVNSMDSVDSGCALGKSEEVQSVNEKNGARTEFIVWEFEVPKHLVGRLIGKQGRFVSFLKESSGAKIYICTVPYTQDYQMCHLEGTQQQIDRALFLIGKKFKELNLTNIFAPPPSMALHSLPMTSWLMLPDGVTVEVIVVNVVNAGHMFVQQHTHPTFHALRGLDQQMFVCYSQSGIPTLPTPVEVGVICAAPMGDNAWWRAQVVAYYRDSEEVEIRYVDYGGYERVKVEILRQIRSDFVSLPFQGAEVLLDNVIPVTDEDHFSTEADVAANEMTRGTALLAQVTNYDGATGLPLVQLWSMMADEVVSINRTLVERGFAQWIDGY